MSMRDEQDDSVDTLIDDTARSLTNGRLRAGFATRVRARIAHPRVESWRVPVWQPALAALVLVLLVGRTLFGPTVERRDAGNDLVQPTVSPGLSARDDQVLAPVERASPATSARPRPAARRERRPVVLTEQTLAFAPTAESDPDALVVERVVIDPLPVQTVAFEALDVSMPLLIERLSIDSLLIE